jgi:hypothetical protein
MPYVHTTLPPSTADRSEPTRHGQHTADVRSCDACGGRNGHAGPKIFAILRLQIVDDPIQ